MTGNSFVPVTDRKDEDALGSRVFPSIGRPGNMYSHPLCSFRERCSRQMMLPNMFSVWSDIWLTTQLPKTIATWVCISRFPALLQSLTSAVDVYVPTFLLLSILLCRIHRNFSYHPWLALFVAFRESHVSNSIAHITSRCHTHHGKQNLRNKPYVSIK